MKKYLLSFLFLTAGILSVLATVSNFVDDDDTIKIKKYIKVLLKDKTVKQYEIQDVDSIYFETDTIKEPQIKGVELSADTISIYVNETAKLTYKVLGENVEQICQVYSLDSKIASYDKPNTLVTGVSVGETQIVAIAKDGIHTDTCVVIVNKEPTVDVTEAYFGESSIKLEPYGERHYLKLHFTPENATPKSIEYTSSANNVATAEKDEKDSLYCVVTSKVAGTTTITATIDGKITATCLVTVASATVAVSSVSISKTSLTLEPNKSEQLSCTVLPDNASNKKVTWSSSDESVATVSSNGMVVSKAEGTAVITVASVDGVHSASCTVTVKSATPPTPTVVDVTSVELKDHQISINTGSSTTLGYTIYPSDATNKNVKWKSEDESIATVSSTGLVRGIKQGVTTITVTTVDGGYSDKCSVTVNYVAPYFLNLSNVNVTATTASATTTLAGDVSAIAEAGLQYSLDPDFGDTIMVAGNFKPTSTAYSTTITDLKEMTTYYCRSYMKLNNETNDTIFDVKVFRQFTTKSSDPYPIAEAVDLGLPSGLLWSSWNMGASEKGEYGGYYCWGDANGEYITPQEYRIATGVDNISGDAKYDMATAQWGVGDNDGHKWRLPYVSEFDELFANCTEKYVKDYFGDGSNVEVKVLTGPNGNSIVLPRGGYMDSNEYKSKGVQGCYWSCESYSVSTGVRWYYNSTTLRNNWSSGTSGFYRMSIRPVLGDYVPPKTDEDIEKEDKAGETEKAGEAVQLGLNVRWANCNVGAATKKPTEFGDFYAWGERTVKEAYTLETYQLYDALTKAYTYIGDDINGTIYDVASSEWGGKWYTPTDDDWYALVNECTWVWKENYQGSGINGYQIFGKGEYENNYIFLPATGFKTTFGMYENAKGYYWSSSVFDNTDKPDWNLAAWYVSFSDSSKGMSYFDRYSGYSIRPVKK